jgi:hypothetical protein
VAVGGEAWPGERLFESAGSRVGSGEATATSVRWSEG